MTEIDTFLDELASASPVPGGGSAAALSLSMAAALVSMVCELTIGRAKYAEVEPTVSRIRNQAEPIRLRARQLMDLDADAFASVAHSMKLPRTSEEEKTVRRNAVQEALKAAVAPPLETMTLAADVIGLAVELAPIGNRNAISDVGSGALAAHSAFHAALLNVEINLAAIRDATYLAETRAMIPSQNLAEQGTRQVMEIVLASIRGQE